MALVGQNLLNLGWNDFFERQLTESERGQATACVARIVEEHRRMYWVETSERQLWGELPGKFYFDLAASGARPAVGDWVVLDPPGGAERTRVRRVLDRQTKFSRNSPGEELHEQVIAANIDVAFLVMSLNLDFNARRLERYMALVNASGAKPVVLLTKTDLVKDPSPFLAEVLKVAPSVPIHPISAKISQGLEHVLSYVGIGRTAVLLGSSGVGKSTLLNRLIGSEIQRTAEIREADSRGRHTTTARRLLKLPDGGNLIDTPGMRELQMWEAEEGIEQTFADVLSYVERCRFRDCVHGNEPDCAVAAAIKEGVLDRGRVASFKKLIAEQAKKTTRRERDESAKNQQRGKKRQAAYNKDAPAKPSTIGKPKPKGAKGPKGPKRAKGSEDDTEY